MAMSDENLRVDDDPARDDVAFLHARLYEANAAATGVDDGRWLSIIVRDASGGIVAGLHGWTWGGTGSNVPWTLCNPSGVRGPGAVGLASARDYPEDPMRLTRLTVLTLAPGTPMTFISPMRCPAVRDPSHLGDPRDVTEPKFDGHRASWWPGLGALGGVALLSPLAHAASGRQESAVESSAEEITLRLLYQLLAILVATRLVTWMVRRLGQTDVSGEILAGLLLGPSLLGGVAPGFMHELFHPSTGPIFTGVAQIGLIFLMFQIGLEFEFDRHLGRDRRPIVLISLFGIAVPFVMGYLTAPWVHTRLAEPVPLGGFQLFFAVAMSITAIPVLGRIFMELSLAHTRTAALTIGAAALDDVSGWMLLGAISLLVTGAFSWGWVLPRVIGLVVYLVLVFVVARAPLRRAIGRHMARHGGLASTAVPYVVILLLASAAITSNLGVFAIIGGFVVGVALHDDRRFVEEWRRRVSPIVWAFFLPVFFAYTGLRTDVTAIWDWRGVTTLFLVLAVAFVSKLGGAYVAARLVGEGHRSALTIGVSMNTRGLMELIVLNIGRDLGLLPTDIFSMLVIMTLLSTFMATPLIRRLMESERSRAAPLGEPSANRVTS